MSKSGKIVSYMEKRYGKEFTYMGETNGMFGNKAFTARLSCPDYPEGIILASRQEKEGEEYYSDNYMAFCYHEDAFQKIDEAVGKVFDDYLLLFGIPDVLLTIEEPESYTLNDYLADPLAFKSVRILVYDDVDESAIGELMKVFENMSISVKGVVAALEESAAQTEITEENVDSVLANRSRVKIQVNFNLENGTLVNEDWRQ